MTTFIDWNDRYDLGVTAMNDEHKTLIAHMNALYAGVERKAPSDELVRLAAHLHDYVVKHFTDEERYMESIGFADVGVHKLIHKDLLTKLDAQIAATKQTGAVGPEFFQFLKFWLSSHICGIDAKYGAHAKHTHQAH